jgi:sirohydrochlorin cobaltochelatase
MRDAVLFVGHGSRDPAGVAEVEALVAAYRAAHPAVEVGHGYVELATPSLADGLDAIARRASTVVVVPLFLFAAGHVKNDVPLALAAARRAHPAVRFIAAPAFGVTPPLLDLARAHAVAALHGDGKPGSRAALVVVGRGASDPDANGDLCKAARLVGDGAGFAWVLPCFIGVTGPRVAETLELVARARPDRLVVLPYFLFAGRLLERLQAEVDGFAARHPWIRTAVARHLGGDPAVIALLEERRREALGGERPLPCDTCQYRVPVSGIADKVGGLQALLWSVRHGFTHTQAMPHLHAHRPLRKHVLVCGNADCASRGSLSLLASLRRLVKEAGRDRDLRVTRTACMGRCGEGPAVAVYPDGIWYRGVADSDAAELVREHLLADRLVARLVDDILQ